MPPNACKEPLIDAMLLDDASSCKYMQGHIARSFVLREDMMLTY
jgi:hypothetical protein